MSHMVFSRLLTWQVTRLVTPLLLALIFAFIPLAVHANIIDVDGTMCTLPEAIENANTDSASAPDCAAGGGDDVLRLAPITHLFTAGSFAHNGMNANPSITSTITLVGDGGVATIARGGSAEFRLLHIGTTGNLTLDNVIVRNGYIAGPGGGIYNLGQLTLRDSQLISNTATGDGGGLFNQGATATITNSLFLSNTAESDGGGVFNGDGSTLVLTDSLITRNFGTLHGGGIMNAAGSEVMITRTPLRGNHAGNGGGFYNTAGSTITLTDSPLDSNIVASYGGGFVNISSATATLLRSDIVANAATNGGGFFSNVDATTTITQAQVVSNTAASGYGGAFLQFDGMITINQSCIVGNGDTAVHRDLGSPIEATGNWWGAADGPSGVAPGSGDSVSANVSYSPFLTSALPDCFSRAAALGFSQYATPAGDVLPGQPLTYTLIITNNNATLPIFNSHLSGSLPGHFQLGQIIDAGATFSPEGSGYRIPALSAGLTATLQFAGQVDDTLTTEQILSSAANLTHSVAGLLQSSSSSHVIVPKLSWSAATYDAEEGSDSFTATVRLSPATPYVTVTAQALITGSAETASTAAVQPLTFAPNTGSQAVVIAVPDDEVIAPHTIQLALQPISGAALGDPSEAVINVSDDEAVLALEVAKSANPAQAAVGDTITYTYRITNTGTVTLTTITAEDDLLGSVADLAGALAPNATNSATLTYVVQASDVPGPLVNTVTVTGTGDLGGTVTGTASASVTILAPARVELFLPHIDGK